MSLRWNRPEENLAGVRSMAGRERGTDLIVLPEMFTTGFAITPPVQAEEMTGRSVFELRRISADTGIAIAGSMAIRTGGREGGLRNRFLFVYPDGRIRWYDKRHLFRMAGEDRSYSAGSERPVWEYKGFRIRPAVCYDLRFPVWLRNRNDYDLLICVANWPSSRQSAWDLLLRARAVENHCYVVGCNAMGTSPDGTLYTGGSAAVGFKGEVLAGGVKDEAILRVRLDKEALSDFRKKFPVYLDADEFTL